MIERPIRGIRGAFGRCDFSRDSRWGKFCRASNARRIVSPAGVVFAARSSLMRVRSLSALIYRRFYDPAMCTSSASNQTDFPESRRNVPPLAAHIHIHKKCRSRGFIAPLLGRSSRSCAAPRKGADAECARQTTSSSGVIELSDAIYRTRSSETRPGRCESRGFLSRSPSPRVQCVTLMLEIFPLLYSRCSLVRPGNRNFTRALEFVCSVFCFLNVAYAAARRSALGFEHVPLLAARNFNVYAQKYLNFLFL